MKKVERKRRQRDRTKKYREKMIAEGKKQYSFYLDSEAQEYLDTVKSIIRYRGSATDIPLSELFKEILLWFINHDFHIDDLETEIKELKEKYES